MHRFLKLSLVGGLVVALIAVARRRRAAGEEPPYATVLMYDEGDVGPLTAPER